MSNHAKNLLVISSYPKKGQIHGSSTVGVASYAKNTLQAIVGCDDNTHITVLAEKLPDSQEHEYQEGKIRVKRIWKRGGRVVFQKIINEIKKNHQDNQNVLIEFELSMFGGIIQLIEFPLFLTQLRKLNKKTTIVLHQVIDDMNSLSGHINIPKNSVRIKLYNLGLRALYKSIIKLSDQVIVFDLILKNRLNKFANSEKITVIPHGVEKMQSTLTKTQARQKLKLKNDDFVITVFGYLAWYKGTDWIQDALKDHKKIKLILAGGPNPNHLDKYFYKKYIAQLKQKSFETNTTITGFVPEEMIESNYLASDLIALPYRALMSASGPLSIALTFKKPFLISKALEPILLTDDADQLLKKMDLKTEDLVFRDKTDLINKCNTFINNPKKLEKLSVFSEKLGQKRSWQSLGRAYHDLIFKNHETN